MTLKDILLDLRESPAAGQVEFMVLYLCNNPDRCYGRTASPDPARVQSREPGPSEVFSPVRALLGARDARGSLAIANMKQAEGLHFFEFGGCPVDKEPAVPLGWQLSERMRARLSAQAAGKGAKGNGDATACVKRALGGDLGPASSPSEPACEPALSPAVGCRSETP